MFVMKILLVFMPLAPVTVHGQSLCMMGIPEHPH